jgi:Ca-activated chloride channel family protein
MIGPAHRRALVETPDAPMRLLAPSIVGLIAAGALLGSANAQQPTFRSAARTVPVYATVTEASGRLVPNLTRDDFEIYDNGRPQPITSFSNDVVPFSAVLTLDTSGSMTANISFVQDAAVQFVIRMLPKDAAAVAYFNARFTSTAGLSSDRDGLVRYIREQMQYGNETRLWDAMNASMDLLRGVETRKVVVALTDGDDWGSRLDDDAIVARAQQEDVMLYAIGIESQYHNGQRFTITRPGRSFWRIAQETGGGHFELKRTADLNPTFSRVIQELHSQYLLGFSPESLDGKTHKLEVRVKQTGLTPRARRSYLAR